MTHPTALPHAPPPSGSVTADTWSVFDWEPAGLPDSAGYGADVIARPELEHKLLELTNEYPSKKAPTNCCSAACPRISPRRTAAF